MCNMDAGNDIIVDEMPGEFYLLKTAQMDFFGIMTKAAMEREISKGNFMPPSGHSSVLFSIGSIDHRSPDVTRVSPDSKGFADVFLYYGE